jgi:hypothetical protein
MMTEKNATLSRWRAAGASVAGSGHGRMGLPCQDAHRYGYTSAGLFVAVVADGAGSAKQADEGANLAVQSAIDALIRDLGSAADWNANALCDALRQAAETARNEVIEHSLKHEIPLRELASTLILAVASPAFAVAGQIGDGAVVIGDAAGELTAMTTPDYGEYVNETNFHTAPDALIHLRTNAWSGPLRHVSLFSDGLQSLALRMPEGVPHPGFFLPLFRFVADTEDEKSMTEMLSSFLSSEKVRGRTDDDVTLVVSSYSGS